MAFKIHFGTCAKCGKQNRKIVIRAGYCERCNHQRKIERKLIRHRPISFGSIKTDTAIINRRHLHKPKLSKEERKKVFSSLKRKFRKPTGELELFKKLWNQREHKSELSEKQLHFFSVGKFHHILSKKAYPKFRLNPENIIIITNKEHFQIHNGTIHPMHKFTLDEMAQVLKEKYHRK